MNQFQPNSESPDALPRTGPQFAAASQPSYARTLFFGPDGLRPGWGFAFYALSFLALQKMAASLVASHDFGASGLWAMLQEEFAFFIAAVIPSLALARIEHRPWGAYGLPTARAFGRLFWSGSL